MNSCWKVFLPVKLRAKVCLGIGILFAIVGHAADQPTAAKLPFTVARSVESVRLLPVAPLSSETVLLSPDASRYLCVLSQGDVARNDVRVRFVCGKTASLETAKAVTVAELFTPAYGNLAAPLLMSPKWLNDGQRVSFLWENERGEKEVRLLDADTGAVATVVRHDTEIVAFDLSPDGTRVVFCAFAPRDKTAVEKMNATGYAITPVVTDPVFSFLRGDIDGWYKWAHVDIFMVDADGRKRLVPPATSFGAYFPTITFSPDGKHALMRMPVGPVPEEWSRYQDPLLQKIFLPDARANGGSIRLSRDYIVDLEKAQVRPLWNAPRGYRETALWGEDGRRLVVGPTFLPLKPVTGGVEDQSGFAVVDVETGEATQLVFPENGGTPAKPRLKSWSAGTIEFEAAAGELPLRLHEATPGQWQGEKPSAGASAKPKTPPVRIEVRQDLNTPPSLVAVEVASGKERTVLELEPDLVARYQLAPVRVEKWKGRDGRNWTGLLYEPVNRVAGKKYPLVIQTHGYSTTEFSLIGIDKHPTVFAAQALANRGMAVLQMDFPDEDSKYQSATTEESRATLAGFEGAVDHLEKIGLVDPAKVGICGFSRTGWHVEYAVAHSDFPFAAAIAADNIDASYVQSMLYGWAAEPNGDNGGEPFGEGMKYWLENAVSFNVQRIRTPLRLQVNSGGLLYALASWENFSRLKALKKPVEFYLPPKADLGTHNLQNPRQVLASAGGAVDWFDFWLNNHERTELTPNSGETAETLQGQYVRWRKLRELHELDLKKPRPPRLKWTATPVAEPERTGQ